MEKRSSIGGKLVSLQVTFLPLEKKMKLGIGLPSVYANQMPGGAMAESQMSWNCWTTGPWNIPTFFLNQHVTEMVELEKKVVTFDVRIIDSIWLLKPLNFLELQIHLAASASYPVVFLLRNLNKTNSNYRNILLFVSKPWSHPTVHGPFNVNSVSLQNCSFRLGQSNMSAIPGHTPRGKKGKATNWKMILNQNICLVNSNTEFLGTYFSPHFRELSFGYFMIFPQPWI